MSYLGFTRPVCRHYLSQIEFPKILEIGVDRGHTAVALIQNLSAAKDKFLYAGIDILLQKDLKEILGQFENVTLSLVDNLDDRAIVLFEENSLDWLGQNQKADIKFDLVLIDGDHNYHTVFNELKLIQPLIKPTTLIVCDDYFGRYSEKDMFYSEREEYKDVTHATSRQKSEKEGVRNAVIDFISQSSINWTIDAFNKEPCFLYQEDFLEILINQIPDQLMRDVEMVFNFKNQSLKE